MKSNLAGLYIQIEAKKRRINIINLWKVPKWAVGHVARASRPRTSTAGSHSCLTLLTMKLRVPCHRSFEEGPVVLAHPEPDRIIYDPFGLVTKVCPRCSLRIKRECQPGSGAHTASTGTVTWLAACITHDTFHWSVDRQSSPQASPAIPANEKYLGRKQCFG